MVLAIASLTLQAPALLLRIDWGAKPPVLPMIAHEIKFLTIHHAGVPTKAGVAADQKLRNLQAWCQRKDVLAGGQEKPAWPDIPYHYYVFQDGTIAEARDWRFVGDTNTEYDPTGHLLLCLEGDFQTETPTDVQLKSLERLAVWLVRKHRILNINIGCHRDYSKQTTCPGDNLIEAVWKLKVKDFREGANAP